MSELLGILFMNIGIVGILRKVEGEKGNSQSGTMVILWKSGGKMVILQKFKKILEGAKTCIRRNLVFFVNFQEKEESSRERKKRGQSVNIEGLKCTKEDTWSSLTK